MFDDPCAVHLQLLADTEQAWQLLSRQQRSSSQQLPPSAAAAAPGPGPLVKSNSGDSKLALVDEDEDIIMGIADALGLAGASGAGAGKPAALHVQMQQFQPKSALLASLLALLLIWSLAVGALARSGRDFASFQQLWQRRLSLVNNNFDMVGLFSGMELH